MVRLVDHDHAEAVPECVELLPGAREGDDGDRRELEGAVADHADGAPEHADEELTPLLEQGAGGHEHERADRRPGHGSAREQRLSAAGGQHHDATRTERLEGRERLGLVVAKRGQREGWRWPWQELGRERVVDRHAARARAPEQARVQVRRRAVERRARVETDGGFLERGDVTVEAERPSVEADAKGGHAHHEARAVPARIGENPARSAPGSPAVAGGRRRRGPCYRCSKRVPCSAVTARPTSASSMTMEKLMLPAA